jgi:hypothetical protein
MNQIFQIEERFGINHKIIGNKKRKEKALSYKNEEDIIRKKYKRNEHNKRSVRKKYEERIKYIIFN